MSAFIFGFVVGVVVGCVVLIGFCAMGAEAVERANQDEHERRRR